MDRTSFLAPLALLCLTLGPLAPGCGDSDDGDTGQTVGGSGGQSGTSGQAGGEQIGGSGQAGGGGTDQGGAGGGQAGSGACPPSLPETHQGESCPIGTVCSYVGSGVCPDLVQCEKYADSYITWTRAAPRTGSPCSLGGLTCLYSEQHGDQPPLDQMSTCTDGAWQTAPRQCISRRQVMASTPELYTPRTCPLPALCEPVRFTASDPAQPAPEQFEGPLAHELDPAATACFLEALRDRKVGKLTASWTNGASGEGRREASVTIDSLGEGVVLYEAFAPGAGASAGTFDQSLRLLLQAPSYFDTCLAASSTSARAQCVAGVTSTSPILPPNGIPPWSQGTCDDVPAQCP